MNRYRPSDNADEFLRLLASLPPNELAELKKVRPYRLLQTTTRIYGWTNLVLGGFILLTGLGTYAGTQVLLLIFGVLLCVASLLALLAPTRQAILIIGILYIFAGLFALLAEVVIPIFCGAVCTQASASGSSTPLARILPDLLPLFWAYLMYQTYRQLSARREKPSEKALARWKEIWEGIAMTRYAQNDQRIEVKLGYVGWIGFLFGDTVALANRRREDVFVLDRSEFNFTTKNADRGDKPIKGRLDLANLHFSASMDSASYSYYQRWKANAVPMAQMDDEHGKPTP